MSADGRYRGPMSLVTLWEPYEISIEPIPADLGIGIGRGMGMTDKGQKKEENGMEQEIKKAVAGGEVERGAGAAGEELLRAERERSARIIARAGASPGWGWIPPT